jgi:hypothetical protein
VNHGTTGWAENNKGSRHNASDDSDDESEADFGDDEEDVDEHVPEESEDEDDFDEDEAMMGDDLEEKNRSLVVKLSVTPPKLRNVLGPNSQAGNKLPTPSSDKGGEEHRLGESPLIEMPDAPEATSSKEAQAAAQQSPTLNANFAERNNTSPAALHATSLAFRGSPEKTHAQPVSRPLDVEANHE